MPRKKGFFALRLRELRLKAGLSQSQLARACDLSLSTVRQFEQGWREPTYGTLIKLAKGLGVSLSEFEQPEGDSPKKPRRPRKK